MASSCPWLPTKNPQRVPRTLLDPRRSAAAAGFSFESEVVLLCPSDVVQSGLMEGGSVVCMVQNRGVATPSLDMFKQLLYKRTPLESISRGPGVGGSNLAQLVVTPQTQFATKASEKVRGRPLGVENMRQRDSSWTEYQESRSVSKSLLNSR